MKRIAAFTLIFCMTLNLSAFSENAEIEERNAVPVFESDRDEDASPALFAEPEQLEKTNYSLPQELLSASEPSREYFEQTIAKYAKEEAAFTDPQVITDEMLFGAYENGVCITESLLNYEKFTMLRDVESAAKSGDYPAAKEALQRYYAEKFEYTDLGYAASAEKNQVNAARLYLENIYTEASMDVVDIFKLTDDFQSYSLDVRDSISDISSVPGKRAVFILVGVRKDGNLGLFYSRETEDTPYIEVTVNSRVRTYYPVADAYVQAGYNSTKNYGDEPVLLVEESYSSINSPMPSRVDSFSKRGYLLFEFGDINPGDRISSARLYLRGKMMKSDNPSQPQTLPDYKDIALIKGTNLQWTDDSLTWETATDNDLINSFNGEYAWECSSALGLLRIKNGISVYKATKEPAYAYAVARMITTAMAFQLTSLDGIDIQKTLDISNAAADFPHMISELSRLPGVTAEKFTLALKYVYAISQRAVDQWGANEEGSNWGVANSSGIMCASIAYPEFRVVDEPLLPAAGSFPGGKLGGWKAVGEYRMDYALRDCLLEDGSCREVSMAYTRYIVNLVGRVFTITECMNIEESEVISPELLDVIEKYLVYLMNVSNPVGGSWQQGDCNGNGHNMHNLRGYPRIIRAVDNPYLNWFANRTQGDPPPYLSVAYDVGGKAVLRSSWDTSAVAAHINADGVFNHSHTDDLSLGLYAYGNYLLVDPVQPNYDTSQMVTGWLYSTRAHNTIEINNTSAKGDGRRFVLHYTAPDGKNETIYPNSGDAVLGSLHPDNREFNPAYNFLRAESFNYQNSSLPDDYTVIRDVLFVEPEYFIITDYLEPLNNKSEINRYAQHWHMLPGAGIRLDEATGNIKTNFVSGGNLIIAPVKGEIPVESSIEWGWYESANFPAEYARYVKNSPGTVTFNTVLYPTRPQENLNVITESIDLDIPESSASAFSFKVTDKEVSREKEVHFYSLHDESLKGQRAFGRFSTDGVLALVQENAGKYDKAIIRKGTNITHITDNQDEKPVIKSSSEISDLSVTWKGDELSIDTSKNVVLASFANGGGNGNDIALYDLEVYASADVKKVVLNGKNITFVRNEDYIGFLNSGVEIPPDQPVQPQPTPTPKPTPGREPSHGGGGGGASADKGTGVPFSPIPITIPAETPSVTDLFASELKGHWGEAEISAMISRKLIIGDDRGRLNLKSPVTRAEFAALLTRAMETEPAIYDGGFLDVNGDEWHAGYIAAARAAGIMEGDGGYAFPNSTITREQMAKMLIVAYRTLTLGNTALNGVEGTAYTDMEDISDWAVEYVELAAALGFMKGMEDGSFGPRANVLREQAFVAVYRLINKVGSF